MVGRGADRRHVVDAAGADRAQAGGPIVGRPYGLCAVGTAGAAHGAAGESGLAAALCASGAGQPGRRCGAGPNAAGRCFALQPAIAASHAADGTRREPAAGLAGAAAWGLGAGRDCLSRHPMGAARALCGPGGARRRTAHLPGRRGRDRLCPCARPDGGRHHPAPHPAAGRFPRPLFPGRAPHGAAARRRPP